MEQAIALSPMMVPSSKDMLQFRSGSGSGHNVMAVAATQPSSSIKPTSPAKNGRAAVNMLPSFIIVSVVWATYGPATS
jgi:hypothetical protein